MDKKVLFEEIFPNGVCLRCFDASRHYYGGFHHIVIETECVVSVDADLFTSVADHEAATAILGPTTTFTKVLSRMAVPSALVDETKQEMVATFMNHTGQYIASAAFPASIIKTNLARTKKTRRGTCGTQRRY